MQVQDITHEAAERIAAAATIADVARRVRDEDIGALPVKNGGTLSGPARRSAERVAAEEATLRVRGVLGIADEIEVRLPSETRAKDDEIARRALDIIGWDVAPPEGRIKVDVSRVTLEGEVRTFSERSIAETAAWSAPGVAGVVDHLRVQA